ncbi:dsDNA nuclease domain-containing protein [Streptomyces sp. SAI-126]|uniref:dsDNA nuclease domain-containing protein n=1 Tax=Streptomyces sp. SAI-126 TaxID=3377732 RepID=UPI003C7BB4F6
MESEPTGSTTFARYRWQAKQAVRHWLTCLKGIDGPVAVICERTEDITIVHHQKVRFAQLKTRDKGSWSANSVCDKGHGIDSLARTYTAARKLNLHTVSSFELWLEGPMSDMKVTVDFFQDPRTADNDIRKKIAQRGVSRTQVDDFLERLVIRVQQPSRSHIDAVILYEMSALWPAHTNTELVDVYVRLLDVASAAQAGESTIGEVHRILTQTFVQEAGSFTSPEAFSGLAAHLLHRDQLVTLVPPLPDETNDDLLARLSRGEATSMLELKMRRAGASESTIHQAQDFRARSDVERILVSAGRTDSDQQFQALQARVLTVAQACASKVHLNAASNPVAAARPADVIATEFLSRPSELAALDTDDLFSRDGFHVYGFLCHLSDECHFPWRAA